MRALSLLTSRSRERQDGWDNESIGIESVYWQHMLARDAERLAYCVGKSLGGVKLMTVCTLAVGAPRSLSGTGMPSL